MSHHLGHCVDYDFDCPGCRDDMRGRLAVSASEGEKFRTALVEAHRWAAGTRGYPEEARLRAIREIISKALGGVFA